MYRLKTRHSCNECYRRQMCVRQQAICRITGKVDYKLKPSDAKSK